MGTTVQPTPKQALILWKLLITGEEPAVSKLQPALSPEERTFLVEAGLIELEKRGRSTHVVLTDQTWQWAANNFDVSLCQSSFAISILEQLLQTVGAYLKGNRIPLAEFLAPRSQMAAEQLVAPLEQRIRTAYLTASGGVYNVRVRLAQLRRSLPDVAPQHIDQVLGDLELAEKLVLMPLDDPQEIGPDDEQAAVTVGGQPRHILYLRG
jgi:hypothetical protein